MNEMYNRETKEWFLKERPNEENMSNYRSLFKRTCKYEELIGKDIMNFNYEECRGLLAFLKPKSKRTLVANLSYLRLYTQWCVEKNQVDTTKNNWDLTMSSNDLVHYMHERSYFKDYNDFLDSLSKYVDRKYDKLFFFLLYKGVYGDALQDIIEAKDSDLDNETMSIFVPSKNKTVFLGKDFFDIFHAQDTGEYSDLKLINEDSPYLIKAYIDKRNPEGKATKHGLNIGLKRFNKQIFEQEKKKTYFTTQTIRKSGLLYGAHEILISSGKVTRANCEELFKIFDCEPKDFFTFQDEITIHEKVFFDNEV